MSAHPWPLGIVSNCWGALLGEREGLEAQCVRALEAGYQVVELRQRALAECQQTVVSDERPWPVADRLERLHAHVPGLQLHLAVEAPFISQPAPAKDAYLDRCIEAAKALGGGAFLRLVDLAPTSNGIDHDETIDMLGDALGGLGAHCWGNGLRLVVENARQPLSLVRRVIDRARFVMPRSAPPIGVCWDPANMVGVPGNDEDPLAVAATFLSAGPEERDELAEVHYKQRRGTEQLREVGAGDIDWAGVHRALAVNAYRGPFLFEIPAGPDIWERLARSRDYIEGLAAGLPSAGEQPSPEAER